MSKTKDKVDNFSKVVVENAAEELTKLILNGTEKVFDSDATYLINKHGAETLMLLGCKVVKCGIRTYIQLPKNYITDAKIEKAILNMSK